MSLKRELNLFDATMVVVGGIIGTGIFINPYIVARALDSTTLVLGAWFAGGVVAIIGALACAELGQQQPRRTMYFAAVAGEEQGLLGSKYLADRLVEPRRSH